MKKYWDDPFVFSFEAEIKEMVIGTDRIGLIFEETYFYPEGGGQPNDRGTIASLPVIDVQEVGEAIVHYLACNRDTENVFKKGMTVACEIDREYRIHNMRLHTGCHL